VSAMSAGNAVMQYRSGDAAGRGGSFGPGESQTPGREAFPRGLRPLPVTGHRDGSLIHPSRLPLLYRRYCFPGCMSLSAPCTYFLPVSGASGPSAGSSWLTLSSSYSLRSMPCGHRGRTSARFQGADAPVFSRAIVESTPESLYRIWCLERAHRQRRGISARCFAQPTCACAQGEADRRSLGRGARWSG
jgi:hypothetical protein